MYSFLSVRKSNVLLDIVYKMQSIHKTRFRSFLQFEEDYETWTTVVVACIVVVVVLMMLCWWCCCCLCCCCCCCCLEGVLKLNMTQGYTPLPCPPSHMDIKQKFFSAIDFFAKIVLFNDIMLWFAVKYIFCFIRVNSFYPNM